MKKTISHISVMNKLNYFLVNFIYNIISILIIYYLYNHQFFGEVNARFLDVFHNGEFVFYFVICLVAYLIVVYLRFRDFHIQDRSIFQIFPLMLFLLFFTVVVMSYGYYIYSLNHSSLFLAWLCIISNLLIFYCLYVLVLHRFVDKIFHY